MSTKTTIRERMLDWIRNGDPSDLPICMSWDGATAGSYMGREITEVTLDDRIRVAEELGIWDILHVTSPSPFSAVPFVDGIELREVSDTSPDGVPRVTTYLDTPEGTLKSVIEMARNTDSYHREFFIKGPEDLPAFVSYFRKCCDAFVTNPAVVESVKESTQQGIDTLAGRIPAVCHVFGAAVELLSSYYVDQTNAIYLFYDYPDLYEELMEYHWKMTEAYLKQLVEMDLDIYTYAINGYEWMSEDLYTRFTIPQAAKINDVLRANDRISWLHTCGKLKRIAEAGMYQQAGVDVLESLSSLPTGDIDNLAKTRADIGHDIVTRGGMNLEWFYETPEDVKKHARYVIDSCSGYKNMIGDTDGPSPLYPWVNIQALIDAVRDTGRHLA